MKININNTQKINFLEKKARKYLIFRKKYGIMCVTPYAGVSPEKIL